MKVRFYIVDGRLFQWDTGRKVAIVLPEGERIDQVHFAKYGDGQALVTEPYVYEEQLVADVPNILLNEPGMLYVYAMTVAVDGRITRREAMFAVTQRPMPSDYIYTETQLKDYATLEKRVEQLEAFTESDPTVPEWAAQPDKPKYTAAEVGAVSLDGLSAAVEEALAQANESGMFDGPPGQDGQPGADGYTPEKGIDYWTEADKEEIVQDVLAAMPAWEGGSY